MKEFYLVPRKIAEHYAIAPNIDAKKQLIEEDREKENQTFPEEAWQPAIDKQLSTPLPPGSFSRVKGKSKKKK